MADYPRRDYLRAERRKAESHRRLRTRRPIRGGTPAIGFQMYGQITFATAFIPQPITLDPMGDGDYPEYKRLIGVDGWLSIGEVTVSWQHNTGYFYEGHVIAGGTGNRVLFDGLSGRPEPYVITNEALYLGVWIRPEVQFEPPFPAYELNCVPLIETVPV